MKDIIMIRYGSKIYRELVRKYNFYPVTNLMGEIWYIADTGSTLYKYRK